MTNNTLLVQKHRSRMKEKGCLRLEVTIGSGMVDQARELAKQRRWPLWRVVEEAIETYVLSNQGNTGNKK